MSPLTSAARFCCECGTALVPADARQPPHCMRCGHTAYADPKVATGVLVERDGRLLLVRRNHEPAMGHWSFPSGYVDAGEVVEDAATREVQEETGLRVRLTRLIGVYSTADEQVIFIAYAGEAPEGKAVAGEEAYEVDWFPHDKLPQLAFPHDPEIVDAWRNGNKFLAN